MKASIYVIVLLIIGLIIGVGVGSIVFPQTITSTQTSIETKTLTERLIEKIEELKIVTKITTESALVHTFSNGESIAPEAIQTSPSYTVKRMHDFSFHNVTVFVRDNTGNPVRRAFVKAYSLDWGVMYPHYEEWGISDDDGAYRFTLPAGFWVFIASGGWEYSNLNHEKGLFLATVAYIDSDASITLKPERAILLKILNESGAYMPVHELYIFITKYIPAIPPALAGHSDTGTITLYTNLRNEDLTILAIKRPSKTSDGYILVKNMSTVSQVGIISPKNTSKLTLIAYEPNGSLSSYWNVEFRLPNLYAGNWVYSFQLTGKNVFHITPVNIVLTPRYIPPTRWYYYFEGITLQPEENREYSLSFGGKMSFHLWVIKQNTQLWFDLRDEFGNILEFYSDPTGGRNITFRILEDGIEVYRDNIGKYIPATLFYGIGKTFSDLATFDLYMDLGPLGDLGNISIRGLLYDASNLVKFKNVKSEHFTLRIPVEYFWNVSGQMREEPFIRSLETVYRSMGDLLDEELKEPHSVEVNFEWCGVGGTNFVGFGLGMARRYNVHSNYFFPVLSHELGHLYSCTPPLIYYVECPLFCEPLATYLGIEALAALYGPNIRLWYWGTHPGFFDYLQGDNTVSEIERMQFVFFYLHRVYGPEIHKQFIRLWAKDTLLKEKLMERGFNVNEAMIILYSHLAKENLAWLFQVAGYNISEERVEQGLALIRPLKVSGFVSYEGKQKGTIYVCAFNESVWSSIWSGAYIPNVSELPCNITADDRSYLIMVPTGKYYFAAFTDVNGNSKPDSAEPIGIAINKKYPEDANLIEVSKDISNVNLTLYDVDLNVSDVRIILENREVIVIATVVNLGGSFAENFKVSLYVNETEVASETISLYFNETKYVEFRGAPEAGTYNIKVTVDPDNIIPESNEENNNYTTMLVLTIVPITYTKTTTSYVPMTITTTTTVSTATTMTQRVTELTTQVTVAAALLALALLALGIVLGYVLRGVKR